MCKKGKGRSVGEREKKEKKKTCVKQVFCVKQVLSTYFTLLW